MRKKQEASMLDTGEKMEEKNIDTKIFRRHKKIFSHHIFQNCSKVLFLRNTN